MSSHPRTRISSFFLPRPPITPSPLAHEPPQENLAWAARNGARTLSPRVPTHDILASADLAVAIPLSHLPTLRSRLQAMTSLRPPTMSETLHVMNDLEVQLALRRDASHYSSTPMNGFCTICVLDAVHRGTAPTPFATPGLTDHILSSLTVITTKAQVRGHTDIALAMQRYISALDVPSPPQSLSYSEWMDESLTMATGRLTDNPLFQTWSEHSQGIFPAGWMQLNTLIPDSVFQHPSAGDAVNFPSLFQEGTPHCGYAQNHHFLARFTNTDLLAQLKWLVLNIASASTALPALTHGPDQTPPSLAHAPPLLTTPPALLFMQPSASTTPTPLTQPPIKVPDNSDALVVKHGNLLLRITTKQYMRLVPHVTFAE